MDSNNKPTFKQRKKERGAALITTLLISTLLLGAGGALVLTTSMSANTAVDSTSEMQAYYVAEAGMQSALNALRGNVQPLVTSTDRMSFRTAIIPQISNGPGNSGALRFAGWLPYNNRMDPASLVPVSIGAVTGGYRITVDNLDPNSHIVEFETSGVLAGSDVATPYQRTYGTVGGPDEVTIRYVKQPLTLLSPDPNTFPLISDSSLGSFVIERPLTSTQDGVVISKTSFNLTVVQTKPWAATTTFEASIEGVVNAASSTVKVTFDKLAMRADGTTFTLNISGVSQVLDLAYSSSPGTTTLATRVTSPDPKRLLIKSYGFGARGSEKRLQLLVTRENLDFETPAGTTLKGADDCSALDLDSGSSGAKYYSGIDYSGKEPTRPAFAVSPCDQDDATTGIKKPDTVADPKIGLLGTDVNNPSYLDSADMARAYLNGLQAKAQTIGRYFPSGKTIDQALDAPLFTFVDGDATLMNGSGFLVVTGTLTMRGDTNFKGVIVVMGGGTVVRNGGGNGEILGGLTIAKFDRSSGGFLAPSFHTNGGGTSNIQYDSTALGKSLSSAMNVSGVLEF
ncbi:MAG TPA: hypothetical protein VFD63_25195 [Pyrinomonadaceae bacterium]|nr:hypothetical protein [Pyrinomonadaceae bacterium]